MRRAKENCVKIPGFIEERGGHGAQIQFTGSSGICQYHNENIPVIEMKCDLFPNCRFRQKQSKIDLKLKKVLELSWKSTGISFSCFCTNPDHSTLLCSTLLCSILT